MTKIPNVSSDDVTRVLRKMGFTPAPKRGKGSHLALYRVDESGRKRLVIIPKRKDLPRGTFSAILEQAGITAEEFLKLL